MKDDIKTDAEKVMKRCQIGTTNYEAANNLHAECYGTIGRLLAEVERLAQPKQSEVEIEFKEWMHPQMGVVPVDPKTPLILKAHIREKNA